MNSREEKEENNNFSFIKNNLFCMRNGCEAGGSDRSPGKRLFSNFLFIFDGRPTGKLNLISSDTSFLIWLLNNLNPLELEHELKF